MKNLATYYEKTAYADALIIIAQTAGVGKSARISAVLFTKAEAAELIGYCARLEKTSPRYKARSKKTQHFRLDQNTVRGFIAETGYGETLMEWKKCEYDLMRETFRAETDSCRLGAMCDAENIGKRVLSEGHFGEWLIHKLYGMEWQYNTENYKKGADFTYGALTAEIKTVTNGAAQWQPNVNQYL